MNNAKCTLAGCVAILLWSTTVALTRNVAEQFGALGGAALLYSLSTVFLYFSFGAPRLRLFSPRYLLIGGALFVSYEICLSLSLGMANNRIQAVEMGLINYLWPSLTVLVAVCASNKRVDKRLYPTILLSFFGVAWTVSGDGGLSLSQFSNNIASNPLSYSMAFIGAFIWAFYCLITRKHAQGKNAITWFFGATALTLWFIYFSSDADALQFSRSALIDLLIAAVAMGSGYALWNVGIIGGNMMLLAILSYFTPLLSTFFSAYILNIELTATFWQGVLMVTVASLLCWWFTREKREKAGH